MAYGSKEGNYFNAKKNNRQGVPTTTNFSVIVEDNTQGADSGLITIYAENGKRVVGTIPRGGSFIPNPNTSDPSNELKAEFNYFSEQSNITDVKNQAIKTVQTSLSKTADPNQTPTQRQVIARSVVFGPQQGANPDGTVVSPVAPVQPTPTQADLTPKDIDDPTIKTEGVREKYDNYYYPESLRGNQNKQDIIRFTAFKYVGRKLTVGDTSQNSFGSPGLGPRDIKNEKNLLGSVTLPIQPSVTDTNSVQWGSEDLNPLQAFGAAVSYGAQTDIAGAAQQLGNQTEKIFRDSNFGNAARIFLAGKAVGVNGLLSRIGGAILNPNMELLFQGPQLRPFNFTFRLSPRDQKEAQQVKYIIRFFKENMSVQNTADNIFLKAPNVFQINYLIKGERDHPSLNRIKVCALQSCSVDYTPDGSYMTFNDENATMTSYNLTLQFQELEPVTSKDYTSDGYNQGDLSYAKVNINEIGY